jgi:hypothetical protein
MHNVILSGCWKAWRPGGQEARKLGGREAWRPGGLEAKRLESLEAGRQKKAGKLGG